MNITKVAYHEAGHALVAWLLGEPFRIITIAANEYSRGRVISSWWIHQDEDLERPLPDPRCAKCGTHLDPARLEEELFRNDELRTDEDHAINAIRSMYAGAEAEALVTRRRNSRSTENDYPMIADVANHVWAYQKAETRRLLLKALRLDARDLLRKNEDLLKALAEALLVRKTMTEAEAIEVLRQASEARPNFQRVLSEVEAHVDSRRQTEQ